MRAHGQVSYTDWLVTILRWLILLGMALVCGWSQALTASIIWIFIIAALINISLTILLWLNRRLRVLSYVSALFDYCVAMLLFFLSGGINGPLVWAGLLPLITGSLYFGFRGVIWVTAADIVGQAALAIASSPATPVLPLVVIMTPTYALVGLLFSELNLRMTRRIAAKENAQTVARREVEDREAARQHAIFSMLSNLSSTLNYQRVLDMALDVSASTLATFDSQADQMVSAILLYTESENNGTVLQIGSSRRLPPSDQRIILPGRTGLIGQTIDRGLPVSIINPMDDPELRRFIGLGSCLSAYCIPVRNGRDTYGVLLFAHPDSHYFTAERMEVLDIVVNQINIAVQNAKLYKDLELEKERMLSMQEEARKKMARDLHDGPTQSLAAIAMRINFARRLIERDTKATAEELYKIEELARRTTMEIRHMLFTLRPLVLESQGLIPALESMSEKMHDTYNQDVIIEADPALIEHLEVSKQTVAFYIAEEAVNNARKHAQACHVWVRLKPIASDLALLEVQDDGIGFDLRAVDAGYESRGSLGLVNMRERAELVNGVLHLESVKGKGTKIQVAIPLTEQAADRIRAVK